MFDSDVFTSCNVGSSYCVESEEFEVARLTRSTFIIETVKESSIHHITCYVRQDRGVIDRATLTVKTGNHHCSASLKCKFSNVVLSCRFHLTFMHA